MDELDTYARAAARLAGLEIRDAWWPGVIGHLAVLCDNAALVEALDIPSIAGTGTGAGRTPAGGET